MSAEMRLRELTDRWEAAQKQTQEKRAYWKSCLASALEQKGWRTFCEASIAYASADDLERSLCEQVKDLEAEVYFDWYKRERERQPQQLITEEIA